MEVGTDLTCEPFDVLDERRSAQKLRDHHVVPGCEVRPRSREGDSAGEQSRRLRGVAPAAEEVPDTVYV
jgi:hypothetical protein